MKKFLVILAVFLLAITGVAYAAIQGATTSVGLTGQLTETTAGNATAEGGNVTYVNLSATVSTVRWQGFYGNVSGGLQLGIGTDIFYDFTAGTGASAIAVYASQNQTFDFASIQGATAAEVDTRWGYVSGNDQAVDVYDLDVVIGTNAFTSNATLLNGTANTYYSALFNDGNTGDKENFAFGTNVTTSGAVVGFDGVNYNYELLVPVNETQETYYFFLEI